MTRTDKIAAISRAVQSGMQLFGSGRWTEAGACLRRVLVDDPANVVALRLLGRIAYQAGRHEQALGFFNRALQHAPNDPAR